MLGHQRSNSATQFDSVDSGPMIMCGPGTPLERRCDRNPMVCTCQHTFNVNLALRNKKLGAYAKVEVLDRLARGMQCFPSSLLSRRLNSLLGRSGFMSR